MTNRAQRRREAGDRPGRGTRRRLGALVFAAVVALAACGGGGSGSAPPTAPPAPVDRRGEANVEVVAQGNLFVPETVIVSPGTTVTWKNADTIAHNVKKAAPAQDFGGPFGVEVGGFGPGATYSFTFANPGTYDYFCTIHTGMVGTVQVDAGTGSPTSVTPPGA